MVLPRGEAETFEPKQSERGYFLLQSQQYTSLSSADQEKCLCPQGHCLGDSGGNRVLCFDIITPIPFFGRQLSLFPADPVVLPVLGGRNDRAVVFAAEGFIVAPPHRIHVFDFPVRRAWYHRKLEYRRFSTSCRCHLLAYGACLRAFALNRALCSVRAFYAATYALTLFGDHHCGFL